MQKTQFIKDIGSNDEVNSLFLLGAASLLQGRNGPFWRLELKDATGTLEAKIWSPQSQEYANLAAGQFIVAQGRSSLYRDQVQVSIDRLRLLSPEETAVCDLARFLPASPRPAQEMLEELERLCCRELTHTAWKKFVLSVLRHAEVRPRLLTAPAAKSVHHAYVGGLLAHTLSVAGLALRMADHYPELDRQILLVAAVCHDLGKIWEFVGGLVNEYSDAGRLLGHTILGLEQLEPCLQKSGLDIELTRHLKHLILSHHGEHEYGAPKLPQTAAAFVLHHADNID
ncbi:MAG: HD domain-containing protein, partial [Deltaproteobacteria bacterium]|nr:HD domain-containing protein [Deltaproteobacteria bacterium]